MELVTITKCVSARGYHVPPIITLKGSYFLRKYFKNNIDSDTLWTRLNIRFVTDKLLTS